MATTAAGDAVQEDKPRPVAVGRPHDRRRHSGHARVVDLRIIRQCVDRGGRRWNDARENGERSHLRVDPRVEDDAAGEDEEDEDARRPTSPLGTARQRLAPKSSSHSAIGT